MVIKPRQDLPLLAHLKVDPAQAVQNPPVLRSQDEVRVAAHDLEDEVLLRGASHLVGAVEAERCRPLHGGLGNFCQLCPQKVLAQKHTEHGRLRRVLRGSRRQMQPGGGGVGGEEQLLPSLLAAQMNDHCVSGGLVDFLHPCADAPRADFLQHSG